MNLPAQLLNGSRIVPVMGSNMAPDLEMGRDMVVVRPVTQYDGEGIYMTDEEALYYVDPELTGGVRAYSFNKSYSTYVQRYTHAEFGRYFVGKVTATISLHDYAARNDLWCAAAAQRRDGPVREPVAA